MNERNVRYEAVWAPGLAQTDTLDEDDVSLGAAFEWLADAERRFGKPGQIVMYAKQMVDHRTLLGRAAQRWALHSTRSHRGWHRGPTVAVWPPNDATLELAENIAGDTGLCVIAGTLYDIGPWIERSAAQPLVFGYEAPSIAGLPSQVRERLDGMLSFDGHNSFLGGGGKEDAITTLQDIARMSPRPTREDIEAYMRASGQTDGSGAERAGKWYGEILDGKRHFDYRRRVIGRPL